MSGGLGLAKSLSNGSGVCVVANVEVRVGVVLDPFALPLDFRVKLNHSLSPSRSPRLYPPDLRWVRSISSACQGTAAAETSTLLFGGEAPLGTCLQVPNCWNLAQLQLDSGITGTSGEAAGKLANCGEGGGCEQDEMIGKGRKLNEDFGDSVLD